MTESYHGVSLCNGVVRSARRQRPGQQHTGTCLFCTDQSVSRDDGLGGFIASGLKASTFLLPTCHFQNELTQLPSHQSPDSELW